MGSLALGFLVPPLRDVMICLICCGLWMVVASEETAPPCSAIAAIVFPRVLPCFSVASDPIGDAGSSLLGLGALTSVKALTSPSSNDERSRFSAGGSMSFSLLVSDFSVC